MSLSHRLALFRSAVPAVKAVFGLEDVYFCPICARYGREEAVREGDLTLEHVPPEALGGTGIVLTCRSCNVTAGHTIDAAMDRRQEHHRFAEFLAGTRDEYEGHIHLGVDDDEVRARLTRTAGRRDIRIEVIGELNDPAVVARVQGYMESLTKLDDATGEVFNLRLRTRCNLRMARIADLKTAFLVAFAVFGYRYAFSTPLLAVRAQIHAPTEEIINGSWTVGLDTEEQNLLVLDRDQRLVVVKSGRTGVVLPWITSDDRFYDNFDRSPDSQFRVNGARIAWPQSLELRLDLMS